MLKLLFFIFKLFFCIKCGLFLKMVGYRDLGYSIEFLDYINKFIKNNNILYN